MSDLSMADAGPPPAKKPNLDLSQPIIHPVEKTQVSASDSLSAEEEISLADLHQDYIDRITKFLDFKSLVRLQLTCRALYVRGAAAQRLLEFTPESIEYKGGWYTSRQTKERNKMKMILKRYMAPFLTEMQFKATGFRLRAGCLRVHEDLELADLNYIDKYLGGRGTIRHLDLSRRTSHLDAIRFNKFLQDFNISRLTVFALPVAYLSQPAVQKLEYLDYSRYNSLSFNFITDSAIHSGTMSIEEDFDYGELNGLLKKWAAKEKDIKSLTFDGPDHHHVNEAFAGWKIVGGYEEIPEERPVVVRDSKRRFRLLRADGATLYIEFDGDNISFKLDANGYDDNGYVYYGESDSSDSDSVY